MAAQPWFCRNVQEFGAIGERLKQTPCPHCKRVGMLIRHGFLRGRDESHPRKDTVRAQRVLCSNRNRRSGCGRTFSVWLADKIRRLGLTAGALWQFLQRAAAGSLLAAIRALRAGGCPLRDRTLQRIWKRFDQGQSKIRTALLAHCPPPQPPFQRLTEPSQRCPQAAQVLAHLQAAFPDADCPIAAFQQTLRTFFV